MLPKIAVIAALVERDGGQAVSSAMLAGRLSGSKLSGAARPRSLIGNTRYEICLGERSEVEAD